MIDYLFFGQSCRDARYGVGEPERLGTGQVKLQTLDECSYCQNILLPRKAYTSCKKDTLDNIWIFLHPKFPSITDPGKRLPPVISAPAPASRIKVSWDETDEAA